MKSSTCRSYAPVAGHGAEFGATTRQAATTLGRAWNRALRGCLAPRVATITALRRRPIARIAQRSGQAVEPHASRAAELLQVPPASSLHLADAIVAVSRALARKCIGGPARNLGTRPLILRHGDGEGPVAG